MAPASATRNEGKAQTRRTQNDKPGTKARRHSKMTTRQEMRGTRKLKTRQVTAAWRLLAGGVTKNNSPSRRRASSRRGSTLLQTNGRVGNCHRTKATRETS